MNNKNISRKEWRRNKRRAAYLRRKEAKLTTAKQNAETPKRYDLLAQYHKNLANDVRAILEKNHIKYAVLTDYYFVISNMSEGSCKEIETAFKDCTQSYGKMRKPLVVRFSRRKSKTIITQTQPAEKSNTRRSIEKHAKTNSVKKTKLTKHNTKDKKTPGDGELIATRGRNVKKLKYRLFKHNGKTIKKVLPCVNQSSTEKKITLRAKKAVKYIMKKENYKPRVGKKFPYCRKKKVIQQQLVFDK